MIKKGEPLPKEVALIFRTNISPMEWVEIGKKAGMSASTVRNIINGFQPIANTKHEAIVKELLRRSNREARQQLINKKAEIDFLNQLEIA